jgi:hypothetical protein
VKHVILAPLLLLLAAFSPAGEIDALIEADRLEEAFRLAQKRTAAGDADAAEALGWFYDEGRFVAHDPSQAVRYYRMAAEGGDARAQWRLGVMLDQGEGLSPDPEQALRWFEKAAAQDYEEALTSLGVMHAGGHGTRRDYRKAMHYYLKAARAGSAHGFYGVGALHGNGEGVKRNPVESVAWILVALSLGDEAVREHLHEEALSAKQKARALERAKAIASQFGHAAEKVAYPVDVPAAEAAAETA